MPISLNNCNGSELPKIDFHFVFVHMHSTFHRKVGLEHIGVEGGGVHGNAKGLAQWSVT